jgi:hypothetical protein
MGQQNNDNKQGLHKTWQWTSTELKKALDDWEVVSTADLGPSPDEKMLADMQKLLAELKIKLETLSK